MQHTKSTSTLAGDASWLRATSPVVAESAPIAVIRGRDAILALQPLLADFACTTGQTGETDALAYFLSTPDAVKKIPHLLLVGTRRHPDSIAGLTGAVLLFEYTTGLGPGSRVFATADGTGRRTLLARPELRASIAAKAASALVERGAQIVHIAFSDTYLDAASPTLEIPHPGVAEQTIAAEFRAAPTHPIPARWTLAEREFPAYLPLLATFDETLARIGRKTRINLRYYRRRLEHSLGCTFVPSVEITLDDFLAFNRACTYAVPDEVAVFRYNTLARHANHLMRGIRDRDGRWLSLTGLRRHDGFVDMDWQMNRADMPTHSLATVLRSYLIEHEIACGSTRLYFEGGTPQPIERSFLRQTANELTVRRCSIYVRLLQRLAPLVFPPKNYIGHILTNPNLNWRRW